MFAKGKHGLYLIDMNGIERYVGVANKYTKQLRLTFTFISLSVLFGIASIALIANVARAQEEGTSTPNAARAEMRETRASSSEARQEAREERRAALAERAQERITNLAANISNRMEAAIGRLEQITSRIESRIEILNNAGIDTTEAELHVADAKEALYAAAAVLSDIDVQVAAFIGSESPRTEWQAVRATYQSAKEYIRTAHASLRAAVAALKEAVAADGTGNGVSDAVANEARDENAGNGQAVEDTEAETVELTE